MERQFMGPATSRLRIGWLFLFALIVLPSCGKGRAVSEKQLNDAPVIGKSRNDIVQSYGWPDFIGKNVEYKDKGGKLKVAAEMWEYRSLVKDDAGGNKFFEIYCDKEGKAIHSHLHPILVGSDLRKHPPNAVEFKGHWFAYFPQPVPSWEDAQQSCQKMGGYLACLQTPEKTDFVKKLSDGGQRAWIGGYCNEKQEWFWLTGERIPVPGPHWVGGQPNSGPNSWLQFLGGGWHDINRKELRGYLAGFVCEWYF